MVSRNRIETNRRLYPTAVELITRQSRERSEIEAFVHRCFKLLHGADVSLFLPVLMSLRSDSGLLLGALGLREASGEKLFLERYIDLPVEQALAGAVNRPVGRDLLIEVGNLAVTSPGGGRWLITALTAYLYAAGAQWVVFTAGPVLANSFVRLGIEIIDLGPASADRLAPEERAAWGGYYEQKPRVMAVQVANSYQALQQCAEAESRLTHLWHNAWQAGKVAA